MISSPQHLDDEKIVEGGGQEEELMGYLKLFDHFNFTKEERQNTDKVEKVEYIWKGLLFLANREGVTPMEKLAEIERRITPELYTTKFQKVYQFIRLSMQQVDIEAELSTL